MVNNLQTAFEKSTRKYFEQNSSDDDVSQYPEMKTNVFREKNFNTKNVTPKQCLLNEIMNKSKETTDSSGKKIKSLKGSVGGITATSSKEDTARHNDKAAQSLKGTKRKRKDKDKRRKKKSKIVSKNASRKRSGNSSDDDDSSQSDDSNDTNSDSESENEPITPPPKKPKLDKKKRKESTSPARQLSSVGTTKGKDSKKETNLKKKQTKESRKVALTSEEDEVEEREKNLKKTKSKKTVRPETKARKADSSNSKKDIKRDSSVDDFSPVKSTTGTARGRPPKKDSKIKQQNSPDRSQSQKKTAAKPSSVPSKTLDSSFEDEVKASPKNKLTKTSKSDYRSSDKTSKAPAKVNAAKKTEPARLLSDFDSDDDSFSSDSSDDKYMPNKKVSKKGKSTTTKDTKSESKSAKEKKVPEKENQNTKSKRKVDEKDTSKGSKKNKKTKKTSTTSVKANGDDKDHPLMPSESRSRSSSRSITPMFTVDLHKKYSKCLKILGRSNC